MAMAMTLSKIVPICSQGLNHIQRPKLWTMFHPAMNNKSAAATSKQPLHFPFMRSFSSRKNCRPHPFPRCNKINVEESHCMAQWRLRKTHKSLFRDLLWNDECCDILCPEVTRFDYMYYAPSDKLTRRYQRTWAECRDPVKIKKICEIKKIIPPKFKKRVFKKHKRDRCGRLLATPELTRKCKVKRNDKCPKISMKGCKQARLKPRCNLHREPTVCKKLCAPYPSYSECKKRKRKPPRKVECACLRPRYLCEAFEFARRFKGVKKS